MIEENKEDENMKYLNKHSHFHPYGFTVLKKPFKYMRINTVLRCLKKYSGLTLELGFIQKQNKVGTERTLTEGDEVSDKKSDDDKSNEESEEDEVEKSDEDDESSSSSSDDDDEEVCKSVKRIKLKRSPSDETSDGSSDGSDTDEDSGNEKFERMRTEFRSKTTDDSSNVCPKFKKNFSTKSNLGKHYTRCLVKTDYTNFTPITLIHTLIGINGLIGILWNVRNNTSIASWNKKNTEKIM
jgi:hypothetical protein